ncbi:MAG: NAD-dependent epimerase/dehydratase family protein [Chloroflexi bacterium]|nr:NAD-dependent epimerase/dehydratase family protein [Chloroflexota bacterium]
MARNILIIGGTRYFGRILAQRLLEGGDRVTLYTRGNTRPDFWDDVDHIIGDRTDRDQFRAALAGRRFDAVYDQQAYRREDVAAAVEALDGRIGRYVFTSTGSTYHEGYVDFLNTCPFPESALDHARVTWEILPGETEYAAGKRHGEKYLVEHPTIPYTIVRVPAVMGWDDPTNRMWFYVQRALDGGPLLWPAEEQAPWRTLYVEDAAGALLGVLDTERTRRQIYHVAMSEILTPERWVREVWRAAGMDAGHPAPVVYVPKAALERLLPTSMHWFSRNTPYIQDLRKSRRAFGFTTTPLFEWVGKTVNWYRESYHGGDSKGYDRRAQEIELANRWTEAYESAAASLQLD